MRKLLRNIRALISSASGQSKPEKAESDVSQAVRCSDPSVRPDAYLKCKHCDHISDDLCTLCSVTAANLAIRALGRPPSEDDYFEIVNKDEYLICVCACCKRTHENWHDVNPPPVTWPIPLPTVDDIEKIAKNLKDHGGN